MTTAPDPAYIIRHHKAHVTCLYFSADNERLYSADMEGWAAVASTRTIRPLSRWKAHESSVLGIEEWKDSILSQGRDHKLHVWSRSMPPIEVVESLNVEDMISTPQLLYSLDVNTLNFCRFTICPKPGVDSIFLAVPNLVDSNYIDIWDLPTKDRIHAAIGAQSVQESGANTENDTRAKLGATMFAHVFIATHSSKSINYLRVLIGYEDGSVALYSRPLEDRKTIEGMGWTQMWRVRQHRETVMGLALSLNHEYAISVSADALLVKYNLVDDAAEQSVVQRMKHPGNGCVSIRPDGKVCAVGGWDGKVRLFSMKSLKSLGTLTGHREGCFALSFANPISETDEEDEELGKEELISRSLWLASGGKDSKICIWPLISFAGTSDH